MSASLSHLGQVMLVGAGKMGLALARGWLDAGLRPNHLVLVDPAPGPAAQELARDYGLTLNSDASGLLPNVLVLAVKPQIIGAVMEGLRQVVGPQTLVISIAAGLTLDYLEGALQQNPPVIRAMPNAPASVLAGITALCPGPGSTPDDLEIARALFECVGRTVLIRNEALMDAVTGLSGSGPAYVYLAIEALSDAGVGLGISRSESSLLAAQTVFGAAKMLLDSGKSPGALRDLVATPGGTTVAGLKMLEKCNFRSAIMEAVEAAAARSRELGVLINRKKQA